MTGEERPTAARPRRRLGGGVAAAVAILVFAAGCSAGAADVSGEVTLDGTPLNDATISFIPKEGGQRHAGWATTTGGKYAIPAAAGLGTGPFRVEVRAYRATGEKSADPDVTPTKQVVPAAYNTRSELTADIKPGQNVVNFDLKSK